MTDRPSVGRVPGEDAALAPVRAAAGAVSRSAGVPAFLIVGSPRSGTTLVQRLATELPGVAVPPETHFFSRFAPRLARRLFPLDESRLREELQVYVDKPLMRGLGLDVDGVVEDLGGRCSRPVELFGAMLRRLAGDGARLIGEKTPTHLLSWRPIAMAMPWVKFVILVRDPRAVVASNLSTPWARDWHPVTAAERWAFDQRHAAAAVAHLGAVRCLVLRYEDVVADPRETRLELGRFLGIDRLGGSGPGQEPSRMFLPWEEWKKQSLGPITTERIEAWRSALTPAQAGLVAAICRKGMLRFGYTEDAPSAPSAWARLARISPPDQARRLIALRAWKRQVASNQGAAL